MNYKLSVIVPYRDRPEHLSEFVPEMYAYLDGEGIPFTITVVEQLDDREFNRGKLLNVGFLETHELSDYTAFHDVDMLPVKPNAGYHYTETGRQVHCPTEYSMGGVSIVNNVVNMKLNGWANTYWGWGGEDRNYFHRFANNGVQLEESQGFRKWLWGKEHFRELEGYHDPARKAFKKPQQKITKAFKADPKSNNMDGLNNCNYTIASTEVVGLYTIIKVDMTE